MGFLSNYSESQKLLSDDYQEILAQRMAEGIFNTALSIQVSAVAFLELPCMKSRNISLDKYSQVRRKGRSLKEYFNKENERKAIASR